MKNAKFQKKDRFFKKCIAVTLSIAVSLPMITSPNTSYTKLASVYATTKDLIYGDVNTDNKIDLLDMILLKSYLNEKNTKDFSINSADLDGDSKISAKDVTELSMYLLNQTISFPYEMNIDTDEDGLCDYVEKEMLKTDYLKKDTDEDGLNDYHEVYLCNTEPLNIDTGNTGLNDSLKDADEDKLTNVEEIKYGTSPTLTDTDDDGLDDYIEVCKYKTDPLNVDTDGDSISDNGEIILGLNPLKNKSDGTTVDNQKVLEQNIEADNELLKSINHEDNPYILSVSAKSAGYIDESIHINISSYSNYLQNESILGDIIDINYDDKFKMENLKINFNVSDVVEKYHIFRYFEDASILLPIETQYNENNVYAEVSEDGTYCIIDIEKWIDNISYNPQAENIYASFDSVGTTDTKSSDSIEIYFLIYVLVPSSIDSTRHSIATASRNIIDYCNVTGKDIKIFFANYKGVIALSPKSNNMYIDNNSTDDEITEMLKSTINPISDNTVFDYSLTRTLKKSLLEISKMNEESEKYCFVVDVNFAPISSPNENNVHIMKNNGVNFTFICNQYNDNIENYKILSSDGTYVKWIPDFSEIITEKIFQDNELITYNVNINLCSKISYNKEIITEEWKTYFEKYFSSNSDDERKEIEAEISKKGLPDTDKDGTYDCLEIDMKYITFDDKGNIILPTYGQLAKDALKNGAFGTKGLDELAEIFINKNIDITQIHILPLKSNPTIADTDSDGIDDKYDKESKKENIIKIDDELLDDSKIFEDDYKSITNIPVSGNGVVNTKTGEKKNNSICYSRVINGEKSTSKFTIKPKNNSDYLITVNTGKNDDYEIKVYRENWYGKPITIDASKIEGNEKTYFLSGGKEYHISVTVKAEVLTDNQYEVKIEQDNWIYAPNGGIRTCKTTFLGDYRKTIYIPCHVLEKVITYISDYDEEFLIKDLYDLEYCIRKLKIADTNEYMLRMEVGEKATIVGGIIALLPGGKILSLIGNVASVVGMASLTEEFDKNDINIQSLNLDLIYDQSKYSIAGIDYIISENRELWKTDKYIYKYVGVYETETDVNPDYIELARECQWIK